jgi:hypothetical protein
MAAPCEAILQTIEEGKVLCDMLECQSQDPGCCPPLGRGTRPLFYTGKR